MVVPDWFIKLLEVLGLRKREKSNDETLRDLYDQREKEYKKLDAIDLKIKTLNSQLVVVPEEDGKVRVTFSDTYVTKAKSDLYLLRKRFDAISKKLAMINSLILEFDVIIDGGSIDEIAEEMSKKMGEQADALAKLERAASIKVIIDDTTEAGNGVKIKDVSVASSSSAETSGTNIPNDKFVNNKSENTNLTV